MAPAKTKAAMSMVVFMSGLLIVKDGISIPQMAKIESRARRALAQQRLDVARVPLEAESVFIRFRTSGGWADAGLRRPSASIRCRDQAHCDEAPIIAGGWATMDPRENI